MSMTMHILDGGRLEMRRRIYVADAGKDEKIELPVIAVLFRHEQGNVLYDTGCHPSVTHDAEARWGGMAKVMAPIGAHSANVIQSLAALGLTPDDIGVVINSHFHPDHCGCNEFFRKARFLAHADEIAAAQTADAEQKGYLAREWSHPMPMQGIGGGHDVMGDGLLVTVHLPGHTPGLLGLLATLRKTGKVLLVSDAVSLRRHLDNDEVPRNCWDATALRASYAAIRDYEAGGALVICGHDDAQVRGLRLGAPGYE